MKYCRSSARFLDQDGIGLPAAIFVIPLIAVIVIGINLLVSQNAQIYQEEINLIRAFYAAETGAGIGMNTIYPPEEYPTYGATAECAAGPQVYNFIVDGLNNCSASVTCTQVTISGSNYATVESDGTCGDFTRSIRVRTVY